jgi:hypothetical protein
MPIVQMIDQSRNGEQYYSYVLPDENLMRRYTEVLIQVFNEVVSKVPELSDNDLIVNYGSLTKISQRIDQRKEYFKIYHRNTHLSEIREAGLHAYWICKYRPFSSKYLFHQDNPVKGNYLINEIVALHVILSVIIETTHRKVKPFHTIPRNILKDLTYSFGQHELCKEAFMIIAEMMYEYAIAT